MEQCRGPANPFDRAGIYEIHVLGTLDAATLGYLDGMTSAQVESPGDRTGVTVLTGWLPDQAALNGILNALYDHSYTLACVRQVEYRSPSQAE